MLKNGVFRNAPSLNLLYLQYNKIRTIGVNAFMKTSLGYLCLNNNLLNTIKAGVFDHSPELYVLYLNNNNLTKIPKTLFKMNLKLYFISLENNQLTDIESGTFDQLPILTELDLSFNKLVTVGKHDFQKVLTVNDNFLKTYIIGLAEEEVLIYNNSITSIQCENVLIVQKFNVIF